MRVLLDTNVIVSAVTTRGLCADVFRAVLAEHELVTCPQVLYEVRHILGTKFSVPENLIAEYLELIVQDAAVAESMGAVTIPIKDKDDVKIVAAALDAGVHVLVTGDQEVQAIKRIGRMTIMSPRAFWELLSTQPGEAPDRPRKGSAGDR
jgi:putative PIN family toxin of toxin-antitoxin system